MRKYTALIIVLIIVIVGAIILIARAGNEADNATTNTNESTLTPPPATATPPPSITPPPPPSGAATPPPPRGTFSGEEDIQGNDVMVYEITYDGSKYSPASLQIKNGDIVRFKNSSSDSFWPASAPHPQHTDYPEFDAKAAVGPGQTFDFKFTKVGTWKFHDHLKPTAFGSITVSN